MGRIPFGLSLPKPPTCRVVLFRSCRCSGSHDVERLGRSPRQRAAGGRRGGPSGGGAYGLRPHLLPRPHELHFRRQRRPEAHASARSLGIGRSCPSSTPPMQAECRLGKAWGWGRWPHLTLVARGGVSSGLCPERLGETGRENGPEVGRGGGGCRPEASAASRHPLGSDVCVWQRDPERLARRDVAEPECVERNRPTIGASWPEPLGIPKSGVATSKGPGLHRRPPRSSGGATPAPDVGAFPPSLRLWGRFSDPHGGDHQRSSQNMLRVDREGGPHANPF